MNKELQDKVWAVLPNEFREDVKKFYKECNKEVDDVKTICYRKCFHHIELLIRFFGEHNLTSDTEKSTNVTSKPKFKVGDVVKVSNGIMGKIYRIGILQPLEYLVLAKGAKGGWYSESDIVPYIEPHNVEDEEVSKPTHSFGMEEEKSEPATSTLPIRLQVATAAMQGLLNATSVERFTLRIKPSTIAKAAVEYADALLAECGMNTNNEK